MGGYYGSPKSVLKNNKELLGEKNKLTRKDYIGVKYYKTKDPIKSTPEQLEAIRLRVQTENKKRKKTQIMLVLLSFIITALITYFINIS